MYSYSNGVRTIYGHISYDTSFYMEDLNVQPTLGFEYSFEVEYPSVNCCPIQDIYYTQKNYVDLKCFTNVAKNEQVWARNNIHFLSPTDHQGNAPGQLQCSAQNDTTKCIGHYIFQDFEPKRRWFLIGYLCDDLANSNRSLKGLTYNIKVLNEYNETSCQEMKTFTDATLKCSNFFTYVTLPNAFGDNSQLQASTTFDGLVGGLGKLEEPCYPYITEMFCIAFFPPCINFTDVNGIVSTQTIQAVCRESCEDFLLGCEKLLGNDIANTIYCHYFKSKKYSSTCVYKEVTCIEPQKILHGGYHIIQGKNDFSASTVVQYYCDNAYHIEGFENSTCLYSGKWSTKPKCVLSTAKIVLYITLPVMFVGVTVFCAILLRRCERQKAQEREKIKVFMNKRKGTHDAFISYYSSDSSPDKILVKTQITPKLELELENPFKLLIHERDFPAGTLILTNIMNAIRNSNSAIVILSQNYIDSRWCREEFQECVEENKKDPRFQLFVILMEPMKELTRLTDYMEQYLRSKTYLEITDPKLWDKIIERLTLIRIDEHIEMIATTKM